MTKAEKTAVIAELKEKFENNNFFYITDSSALTVDVINKFRGLCFEKEVEMRVVKNTLARKAMEALPEDRNYAEVFDVLKGPTTLLFGQTAKVPAEILKEFRKDHEKPLLKAAYIETSVYKGDDQIDTLSKLKSKEDLVGEIVTLLQSPAKNVVSALQSGGNTLMGLLKALEERGAEGGE